MKIIRYIIALSIAPILCMGLLLGVAEEATDRSEIEVVSYE